MGRKPKLTIPESIKSQVKFGIDRSLDKYRRWFNSENTSEVLKDKAKKMIPIYEQMLVDLESGNYLNNLLLGTILNDFYYVQRHQRSEEIKQQVDALLNELKDIMGKEVRDSQKEKETSDLIISLLDESKTLWEGWSPLPPSITRFDAYVENLIKKARGGAEEPIPTYLKSINSGQIDALIDAFLKDPTEEVKAGGESATYLARTITKDMSLDGNGDGESMVIFKEGALDYEDRKAFLYCLTKYDGDPRVAWNVDTYAKLRGTTNIPDLVDRLRGSVRKLRGITMVTGDEEFDLFWGSKKPNANMPYSEYKNNEFVLYLTPYAEPLFALANAYMYWHRDMWSINTGKYRYAEMLMKIILNKKARFPKFKHGVEHDIADLLREAQFPKYEEPVLDDGGNPVIGKNGKPVTKKMRNPKDRIIKPFTENMGALKKTFTYEFIKGNEDKWKEFIGGRIRIKFKEHPQEDQNTPLVTYKPKPKKKRANARGKAKK